MSMELTCREEESRVRQPDEDEDAASSIELTCREEKSRGRRSDEDEDEDNTASM